MRLDSFSVSKNVNPPPTNPNSSAKTETKLFFEYKSRSLSSTKIFSVPVRKHYLLYNVTAVFLRLPSAESHGSVNECLGFRETKLRNEGRVVLAVLNMYARTKIRVATFDTNHYVTNSTQDNRCLNPAASCLSVVRSVSRTRHWQGRCVRRTIGLTNACMWVYISVIVDR